MSRVFFREPLEAAATFWRIYRRDGVMLALTGHDLDLRFDGIVHRAAPGMLPSAIRRTADLSPDSADVQGALSHDSIAPQDLAEGRFDGARVEIGVVDWETLERAVLYRGEIGTVAEQAGSFEAEVRSAKAALEEDRVPRTSPTCRAPFCGPGCTLSAARYTHEVPLAGSDLAQSAARFAGGPTPGQMLGGHLRWLDGPQAGLRMEVIGAHDGALVVDLPLDPALAPGMRAELREGCDHTFATCSVRFGNAVNFQGEPFLPGNDFMARYPTAQSG